MKDEFVQHQKVQAKAPKLTLPNEEQYFDKLDDEIVDNTNNEEWNEHLQSPGEKSSGVLSGNSDKY